jgi:hypothetical protein
MGTAIFNSKTLVEYQEIYAYALILIFLVVIVELVPDFIIFIIKKIKEKQQKTAHLS